MINIEVPECYAGKVEVTLLERAAAVTLGGQSAPFDCELTIVVTDDEQLHQLNKQFLGIDAPTDVLAFPASYIDSDSGLLYLGDILISFPRSQIQAEATGHPVMDELQLLVVHGVLHLLGHDHAEASEKARMWTSQGEILGKLGLPTVNPPAE